MKLYRLTADVQAWPTEGRRVEYASTSLFAFRKTVRGWRELARYEGNHVLNMHVEQREYDFSHRNIEQNEVIDPAHEKYLNDLRKEQLRADISTKEAAEEAIELALLDDDFDFDF